MPTYVITEGIIGTMTVLKPPRLDSLARWCRYGLQAAWPATNQHYNALLWFITESHHEHPNRTRKRCH